MRHEEKAFSLKQGGPDQNQLEACLYYCHKKLEDGPEGRQGNELGDSLLRFRSEMMVIGLGWWPSGPGSWEGQGLAQSRPYMASFLPIVWLDPTGWCSPGRPEDNVSAWPSVLCG